MMNLMIRCLKSHTIFLQYVICFHICRGVDGRGRGRTVSVYNHLSCEFGFRSSRCVFDTTFCEYK